MSRSEQDGDPEGQDPFDEGHLAFPPGVGEILGRVVFRDSLVRTVAPTTSCPFPPIPDTC